MTANKKAAPGWAPGTAFTKTSYTRDFSCIRSKVKALIVRLALDGVIPYRLADFLIHARGMRHV
jgi:hypothetical protein